MSFMNIDFPRMLHRRLSATAGAKGVTLKAAVIEAADRWVEANAHHVAELGLDARPTSAETAVVAPVDAHPALPSITQGIADVHSHIAWGPAQRTTDELVGSHAARSSDEDGGPA